MHRQGNGRRDRHHSSDGAQARNRRFVDGSQDATPVEKALLNQAHNVKGVCARSREMTAPFTYAAVQCQGNIGGGSEVWAYDALLGSAPGIIARIRRDIHITLVAALNGGLIT